MGKCPLLKRSTTTKTSTHIHVRLVRENSSDSLVMRIFSAYMIMYTMHTMQQQNAVCSVFGWDANASTWIECIRRIRTEKNEFYSPNSLAWFELHHKISRSMLVRDHHNIKRTFVYACIKIRSASSHMWWLFSASVFLSDYERQRRLRCKQTLKLYRAFGHLKYTLSYMDTECLIDTMSTGIMPEKLIARTVRDVLSFSMILN